MKSGHLSTRKSSKSLEAGIRFPHRFGFAIALMCLSYAVAASQKTSPALASMQGKLRHIEVNSKSAHPDETPTTLTEKEINAYLASGEVELPKGVKSISLSGEAGVVTGTAHIDFDQVREGIRSANPLLSIFSGLHDVVVVTHAHGAGHTGYVHVDSVSLDGVEVPHFILQIFVDKYITSKHPDLGMDSRFSLPDCIDTAIVGNHMLAVTQK